MFCLLSPFFENIVPVGLSSILLSPSRLLNLNWDGLVKKGCPVDFVILDAEKWADIFSSNLKREVLINGELYS